MMNLEVNGIRYEGFKSASATKSMETACGTFKFSAAPEDVTRFPIKKGNACRVLVDGEPIITGFIERFAGNWGHDNDVIELSGRDKLGDFVDSGYEGNLEFSGPIQLKAIIEKVLRNNGFTGITVIDKVGTLKSFSKEILSGSVSEKCFEFCERYCRKRQVFLTSDGDGNIVLARASTTLIKTLLLNELNGTKNNIKNAVFSNDDTERFAKVIVKSQFNPSITDEPIPLVDITGKAEDSGIRSTRKLTLEPESALDLFTAQQRAEWEVNIRRARGFLYTCTVYGHRAESDGKIWAPNMLVRVVDERARINAQLLIKEVTYTESNENGSETSLSCVTPDAFTLNAEMESAKRDANEIMYDFEEE